MSAYAKYLLCRFFTLLCICGAGYGYFSASVYLVFVFVVLGLAATMLSIYFRSRASSHKDQQNIAVETLSRIGRSRNK